MREPLDTARLKEFMRQLGAAVRGPSSVYLTGGATAVLLGFRKSTVDIDIKAVPEEDALLRALPQLKERLQVNVELAAPSDFIPEVPGWQERSEFIVQEGPLAFRHYDFVSQALSKIERGYPKDLQDVRSLIDAGRVTPDRLVEAYEQIEPALYKYPAIDPPRFRAAVLTAARTSRAPSSSNRPK